MTVKLLGKEQAKVVVCPVCRYPKRICHWLKKLGTDPGEMVKFADEVDASAVERSKQCVLYHADICPICRHDKLLCRQKKIDAIIKGFEAVKAYNFNPYGDDGRGVERALKEATCQPTPFTGQPVLPQWWRGKTLEEIERGQATGNSAT